MKKKAAPAKKAAPGKPPRRATGPPSVPDPAPLFERVASILEAARAETVRAVNSSMVLAYWLIGREIVEELQEGDERAAYGKNLIRDLSQRLTAKFGSGYSPDNLWHFRKFFLAYADRSASIHHSLRGAWNPTRISPAGEPGDPAAIIDAARQLSGPTRTAGKVDAARPLRVLSTG